MKYEIINCDWYKRRRGLPIPKAVSVELVNFKKEKNSFCTMIATLDNGETVELLARVIYNSIKDHYTVEGMDTDMNSVRIKLLD